MSLIEGVVAGLGMIALSLIATAWVSSGSSRADLWPGNRYALPPLRLAPAQRGA